MKWGQLRRRFGKSSRWRSPTARRMGRGGESSGCASLAVGEEAEVVLARPPRTHRRRLAWRTTATPARRGGARWGRCIEEPLRRRRQGATPVRARSPRWPGRCCQPGAAYGWIRPPSSTSLVSSCPDGSFRVLKGQIFRSPVWILVVLCERSHLFSL